MPDGQTQTILDAIPVPVLVVSHSNEVEHANRAAAEFFRRERKSLIGGRVRHTEGPGAKAGVEITVAGGEIRALVSHFDKVTWNQRPATLLMLADSPAGTRPAPVPPDFEGAFTSIFDHAAHGIAFMTLDGRWFRVNTELCRMVGYSAEELSGMKYQSITHPDDVKFGLKGHEKIRNGEISGFQVQKRYIRKDGREVPVVVSVNVVRDPAGAASHLVTHVVDMTVQKQAESTIRTLMYAIDENPVATMITDTDGKILYANPSFGAVTGYSRSDGDQTTADVLESGDMTPEFYRAMWASALSGSVWRGELVNRQKDGTPYWCDVTLVPVRASGGDVRHIACFLDDISDWKRAEAAIRETNTRLQGVLDSATIGIVVMDLDGKIESFNPAASQMFGYPAETVIGRNFQMLIANYDPVGDAGGGAAPGGKNGKDATEPRRRDVTGRRATGDEFPIEMSINRLQLPGRMIAVAVLTNLTERKQSEKQLQHAQKMEVIGRLTGGIAHDFNNLLGIILGNLQLLQRRIGDDPTLGEFTEAASEAVLRGADLTKRLLAFSRGEDRAPIVLDANELVASMNQLLKRTLEESVDTVTSLKAAPATLRVDPSDMQSAVLNLAINARDAMNGSGRLLIETRNIDCDADHVATNADAKQGRHVCISVTDTGSGIPDDVLPRIFEPFYTTKPAGKGTGLGLSMLYSFVRQSDGHIQVKSEVGRGTTFSIFLPLVDAAPEWSAANVNQSLAEGDETILLIEDDPRARRMATRLLEDLGYAVASAADGQSAMKLLRKLSVVDLLLTDVALPGGMDGQELARRARASRPGIAVLLTSGHLPNAQSGGSEFPLLPKPYTDRDLATAVRAALDHPRTGDA